MFRECRVCNGATPPLEAILSGSHTPCAECQGRGVERSTDIFPAAPGVADASRRDGMFHSRIVRNVLDESECIALRDELLSQFKTPWRGSGRIVPRYAGRDEAVARSDPGNPLGLREVTDVAAVDPHFLRAAVDRRFVALVVAALGGAANLHSTRAHIAAPGDGAVGRASEWSCAADTVHARHAARATPGDALPPVAVAQATPADRGSPRFAECIACRGAAPPLAALLAGTHTPCARCDGRGIVRIDERDGGAQTAPLLPLPVALRDGASGSGETAKDTPPAFVTLLLHLDVVVPHGGAIELEAVSRSSRVPAPVTVEQHNMAVGDVLLVGPNTRHRVGANAAEELSKVWLQFVYTRADAVDTSVGGNSAAFATLPVARNGAPCTSITL